MLIYIALWCDELISQLVTPWLLWPFLILVDLDVTSCKLNSSHYNILIISELSGFVMSDEFLTKLFTVLRINRITYSAKKLCFGLAKGRVSGCKSIPFAMRFAAFCIFLWYILICFSRNLFRIRCYNPSSFQLMSVGYDFQPKM